MIHYCPSRGIVCGEDSDSWCATCPQRAAPLPAAPAPTDVEECTLCNGMGRLDDSWATCPHCNGSGLEPVAALPAEQVPTYTKSQTKMIERAIVGLRDGWLTRKDADDALDILGSVFAAPTVQAVELPPLPDEELLSGCPAIGDDITGYTAEQMYAFRAEGIAADRAALAARQAPAVDEAQLRELLLTLKNASFDCGNWDSDNADAPPYPTVLEKARLATEAAVDYVLAARQVVAPEAAKEPN